MKRYLAFALLITSIACGPALAWEASSGDVCQITHEEAAASVSVTYDLETQDYAIAITPPQPWAGGPVFALRFDGPFANTITTDRHQVSEDGGTLSVVDQGFGNVLSGLAFNDTATALLGEANVVISLDGAASAVAAFEACTRSLRV